MKNVAIHAGTTGSSLIAAQAMLGRVVETRTRWNIASLVASVINSVEDPLLIYLFPDSLVAFKIFDPINSMSQDTQLCSGDFKAVAGNNKSRPLNITHNARFGYTPASLTVSSSEGFFGELDIYEEILLPVENSYTLSSLVGSINAFYENQSPPVDVVIRIDQLDGTVQVAKLDALATNFPEYVSSIDLIDYHLPLTPFVVFDLSEIEVDAGGGTEFVQKPFWG